MNFIYLLAAYNEEAHIEGAVRRILGSVEGAQILILDNGSTDRTFEIGRSLQTQYPEQVFVDRTPEKGMGAAFKMGLDELRKRTLTKRDWVVFAAVDLPFGFSDIEALKNDSQKETILYVGSKAHPASVVVRDWKRRLGSSVFRSLRTWVLGLKTQDTQGSLLLRGDEVSHTRFDADDFFFAVEMIDQLEQRGRVTEIPIKVEAELRPSKVRLIRDGYRMVQQMMEYRKTRFHPRRWSVKGVSK